MKKLFYGWQFDDNIKQYSNIKQFLRMYHYGWGHQSIQKNIETYLKYDPKRGDIKFFSYWQDGNQSIFDRYWERKEIEKLLILI